LAGEKPVESLDGNFVEDEITKNPVNDESRAGQTED
jgi:hypothetical protein